MHEQVGHLLQIALGVLGICVIIGQRLKNRAQKRALLMLMPAPEPRRILIHRHPVKLQLVDETVVPCCGLNLEDLRDGDLLAGAEELHRATCPGKKKAGKIYDLAAWGAMRRAGLNG
jgi:hypothetical protein